MLWYEIIQSEHKIKFVSDSRCHSFVSYLLLAFIVLFKWDNECQVFAEAEKKEYRIAK